MAILCAYFIHILITYQFIKMLHECTLTTHTETTVNNRNLFGCIGQIGKQWLLAICQY